MFFIAALIGYAFGSVPFSYILTKAAGFGDIRHIGSGNVGATNVLRTGNKKLALTTLILDSAKGAVAVCLVKYFINFDAALIAGFFALLGHIFPVWLGFKGGKGVATALGVFLALAPQVGLVACAAWLFTAAATRYSSLASLVATASAPFAAWAFGFSENLPALCAFMSTLIWFKHRDNMHRLFEGTESKIGSKA